jgi:tRNA 2-thiouridine synthesizing protein D
MRFLVTVSASPWGSSRATAAWRFVRAALESGDQAVVFFHDDGIYNAVAGELSDDGLDSPQRRWRTLSEEHQLQVWLCPAASARRLPASLLSQLPAHCSQAGLTSLLETMGEIDRLVSF